MKSIAKQNEFSIDNVIKELKMVASFHFNSSSNRKKASLNAEWLQELLSYKDETLITDKFLTRRFVDTEAGWRFNYGDTKILIQKSADTYHILIFKREYEENKAYIKTLGELRMFLTLCGVPKEFIKKLE